MKKIIQQAFDFGLPEARKMAITDQEHRTLDFVNSFLSSNIFDQYYMHSAFALTSLPHRRPKDDSAWIQRNGPAQLMIEGGSLLENGEAIYCGVPFGSRARLILYYLVTKAIEHQNPAVHLGSTMTAWMKSMKIPTSGKNYDLVREQVRRLVSCRLSFGFQSDEGNALARQNIIGTMFTPRSNGEQVWEETAVLSQEFYDQLKHHKFPVDARAISVLQNQSHSMDVYIWLCYRLQHITEQKFVPWRSLYQQFGSGYSALRFFKRKFKQETLPRAMAVYPKANIEVDDANGLILHPSPPAIEFLRTYRGGTLGSIQGGKKF